MQNGANSLEGCFAVPSKVTHAPTIFIVYSTLSILLLPMHHPLQNKRNQNMWPHSTHMQMFRVYLFTVTENRNKLEVYQQVNGETNAAMKELVAYNDGIMEYNSMLKEMDYFFAQWWKWISKSLHWEKPDTKAQIL